jgi:hypothetical protein
MLPERYLIFVYLRSLRHTQGEYVATGWRQGRHRDCGMETREKPILIGVRVIIMDILINMRKTLQCTS